ncbi:hypothetical protein U91I_01564 [alpha proteobacterium U9-1i]|nr:hypothetical protein U91I_01564 [alpha proteobacterium U9-1i]
MNILVLHNIEDFRRARRSTLDYMFAFQRYEPDHSYHCCRIQEPPPRAIRDAHWDAVILESTALGICTIRPRSLFHEIKNAWSFLANERIVKAVFPQDDANCGGLMDDWFAEWGVQFVFSVRTEHKDVLYPKSSRVAEFLPCLSGYIDDRSLPQIQAFAKPWRERTRLIGQRVTMYPARGGRQGRMKGLIAERVKEAAIARGLAADISTDRKDTLWGDDWYAFLGDCKFALGSEGGLSLNDPYGEISDCIDSFVADHPAAPFEDVEAACFPGLDGQVVFSGFSPRVLEAAVCGASQVLVEGRYLGLLEPGTHYLELKADCSNLGAVFAAMGDETAAQARVAACNDILVDNPDLRYSALARKVLAALRAKSPSRGPVPDLSRATARRSRIEALIQRDKQIGFAGVALARRVGEAAAAQVADHRGGTDEGARIVAASASLRAVAREMSFARPELPAEQALVSLPLELLADLAEAGASVARSSSAEEFKNACAHLADRMQAAVAVAETVLVSPEDGPQRRLERLVEAAIHRNEHRDVLLALAHDPPNAFWSVLERLAPPSTATGSWAVDDLARLDQLRAILDGAPPGSELARLVSALVHGGKEAAGLVSRLKPDTGDRFSPEEIERLTALDRLIIRAVSGEGASFAVLEEVQVFDTDRLALLPLLAAYGADPAKLAQELRQLTKKSRN